MATAELNPAQCDICTNAIAQFNCNTCGDALCPTCKTYHLRSKGSRHHDIVPYAQKLNPKYLAGLSCHEHPNNAPEFWCEKCRVPICATCITDKHKGHECCSITTILSEKRDKMLEKMKILRDKTVREWEEVLKQAKTITEGYINIIEKMEKDLLGRAKDMHNRVEAILFKSQQTLKDMKAYGLRTLKKQEDYLAGRLNQLRHNAQQSEDRLRDADPNVLLQYKPSNIHNKEDTMPPSLKTVSAPTFIQGQNNDKALQEIFGQVFKYNKTQTSTSLPKEISTNLKPSDSGKATVPVSPQSSGLDITKKSLIPKPSIHSNLNVNNSYPRIACAEQGLAWVETEKHKIQLIDRDGLVKDTVKVKFSLNDLALSSQGDILFADKSNQCIKIIESNSVSKQEAIRLLFKTNWTPTGLCCSSNNDIVVAFGNDSKVVV